MRVRITSHIVGRPAYAAGQVVELESRVALAWIEDGLAVPVSRTDDAIVRTAVDGGGRNLASAERR